MRIDRFCPSRCRLLLIVFFALLTACSNNVKDTVTTADEPKEDATIVDELPVDSAPEIAAAVVNPPLWVVGDEWFQRDYVVRPLQELSMNDAVLDTKVATLSSRDSQAPSSLYEGRNQRIQVSGIDNPLLLLNYLRGLNSFVVKESSKPRDIKPVYGYNYQFLLLMSEQQWQGVSVQKVNSELQSVSQPLIQENQQGYFPSPLLDQLRAVIAEHGDFPYAMQLLYDHDDKMLGILGATEKEHFHYMQALLLDEIHTSKDASLLDIPLAVPPWLATGLKNDSGRILRIEYIPKT